MKVLSDRLSALSSWCEAKNLRLVQILALIWFGGALCVFLFYPPYWALMDDAFHVQDALRNFSGKNVAEYVLDFVKADFSWGMFRPVYALFIYVFYGAFRYSSHAAYGVLFFINAALFWIWSCLFVLSLVRFSGGRWQWLETKENRQYLRLLFFVFCFLFSPNYTLLFFASLQERLVLLFGTIPFYALLKMFESEKKSWGWVLIFLLGFVAALLSKANALFMLPPMLLWLAAIAYDKRDVRAVVLIFTLLVGGSLTAWFFFSIRGSYSSAYDPSLLPSRLTALGPRYQKALITIGLTLVSFALLIRNQKGKTSWSQRFSLLVWPLMLLSFLVIMLPWKSGINYYLVVPGGMFWTGCKVMICAGILSLFQDWKRVLIGLILIVIVGIVSVPSARKLIHSAKQHHGTGEAVRFLKTKLDGIEDKDLMVRMPQPCMEASAAMSLYIARPGLIQVLESNSSFPVISDTMVKQILLINGECAEIPGNFFLRREIFRSSPWVVYERFSETSP